jgi:hypothetical protein
VEYRFTKSSCHTTLKDYTDKTPYVVVARDATSVAIVSRNTITHIHFEDGWFWVFVGTGKFREYFRRVGPPENR